MAARSARSSAGFPVAATNHAHDGQTEVVVDKGEWEVELSESNNLFLRGPAVRISAKTLRSVDSKLGLHRHWLQRQRRPPNTARIAHEKEAKGAVMLSRYAAKQGR